MFFGEKIQQKQPFHLSTSQKEFSTFQFTNAVLDVESSVHILFIRKRAQLYLKTGNKEILLCHLNSTLPQSNLNVLIDLKEHLEIITKNGDVHVCGYFNKKQELKQEICGAISDQVINTNKKINQLAKQHLIDTQNTKELQKSKGYSDEKKAITDQSTVIEQSAPRQSSRLSSRRAVTPSIPKQVQQQKPKHTEKGSKKQQISTKKQQKSSQLLQNGRYSLKALLENVDDDQDSDEQFSQPDEENQSDDDSSIQDEQGENYGETNPRQKSSRSSLTKYDRNTDLIEPIQQKIPRQKISQSFKKEQNYLQKYSQELEILFNPKIQIVEEESDEKRQINTGQFQQKWPETPESYLEKEANQRQQQISSLASKIKCPTKKPTI